MAAGVLAKPAGEPHDDVMHGSRQIIVEPDAGAEAMWPTLHKVFDGISYHRSEVAGAVAARIETELATGDPFTGLSVEGLTLELFTTLRRRSPANDERGGRPPWLERVRERLEYDLTITTITELAAIAGVHPAYMARASVSISTRPSVSTLGEYACTGPQRNWQQRMTRSRVLRCRPVSRTRVISRARFARIRA